MQQQDERDRARRKRQLVLICDYSVNRVGTIIFNLCVVFVHTRVIVSFVISFRILIVFAWSTCSIRP